MKKHIISTEVRERLALRLKRHLSEELDVEVGRFEAEGLVDMLSGLVGPYFYNAGLQDAQALLAKHVDQFNDALYELERLPEA